MSTEITVSSWEECEQTILKIEEENRDSVYGVWFRGQANAKWRLETTLEQRTPHRYFVQDYTSAARWKLHGAFTSSRLSVATSRLVSLHTLRHILPLQGQRIAT